MSFELDEDTALARRGEGRFQGRVTGRFDVGAGPNGGYLAGLLLRALMEESPLPDPLTMSVHYLSRPSRGACEVLVAPYRLGSGHATLAARLVQEGETRCASLCTLGRWRRPSPGDFQPPPPAVPGPHQCRPVRRVGEDPPLWERLETRVADPGLVFNMREGPGEAVAGGWARLADGRATDAIAVPLLLDSWPPAVCNRTMEGDRSGAPTIEYTVHWRDRAASDWCYARLETRALKGGYIDEDGQLWDEAGRLVAESRQLARYRGGGGPLAAGPGQRARHGSD